MTTNKDVIIDNLKDQIENLAYKNRKMADFIEALGVNLDYLVEYIINGDSEEVKRMIDYVIEKNKK